MEEFRTAILCLALMNGPVFAQTGSVEERLNASLDKLLAEWTVYVSCTALDPDTQALMMNLWADSSMKIYAVLKEKGVDPGVIKLVGDRIAGLKPVAAIDAPAQELIDYCHGHPDWQRKLYNMESTQPEAAIKAALGDGK
jgi:hypothetical protein